MQNTRKLENIYLLPRLESTQCSIVNLTKTTWTTATSVSSWPAQYQPTLNKNSKKTSNCSSYGTSKTKPGSSTLKNFIQAVVGSSVAGVDAGLTESLPKLEIVATYLVGLNRIDLAKFKEKGIRVANTPDVLTDDVADLAIGLILAVLRKICQGDRYVRSGKWKIREYKLTSKFTGKSVGILGMGRIGAAIAKRAEAFNCNISYNLRTEKPNLNYKYYPNITDLASNCQILVVACSLTEETQHIVNRQVINALGPKGVIINIGRGPLVDEPELVSALLQGRLGGAGLDVFEHEPEVPEERFGLENVVLLPHVASATVETRKAMADLVVGNLQAHFGKKPLSTPVV